jgi:hypothetical protein
MGNKQNTIVAKKYDFQGIGSIMQTLVEDLYQPHFKSNKFKINLTMALGETVCFVIHHKL